MKVSSLAGAATARTAMLQNPTPSAATTPGAGPAVTRPVAMPPPPRASSFGGVDPRAMFEALVQSFDSDGNGTLSLNEVNALNQGGLLARSFGRIDANADGSISGDEIAAVAPWGGALDDQGNSRGASLGPPSDPLSTAPGREVASVKRADDVPDFSRNLDDRTADPAGLMESMVLALGANF